jgi:two-component system sensor histidine kinase MtrB
VTERRRWFGLRRRLLAAFIGLTAVTSGVLALTSHTIISHQRNRTFAERAQREVSLLVLSSAQPSPANFNDALDTYRRHADFDAVIVDADGEFSSTPSIRSEDIPASLRDSASEVSSDTTVINGESFLVVADRSVGGGITYYFLYSRSDLLAGLADFRNVLVVGWLVSVAVATGVGHVAVRHTLRPVADAAAASESVARGDLRTRLAINSGDEFGRLAAAFNDMAETLDAKMSELSEAAAREQRFTAAVAHDLRTPLTVMTSAAELLRDDVDDLQPERARRPLTLLINDVHRLSKLVQELLELARLDAGHVDLESEVFSLRDTVNAVVGWWSRSNQASIQIDVSSDLFAWGDVGCTKRILANLLDNAAKHGRGATELRGRTDGASVHVDVLDEGPGIPDDAMDRIFDRFFKGDSSRSVAGSGLGLALARYYARVQGGSLFCANRDGGGACFTLSLPAGRPGDEQDSFVQPVPGAKSETANRYAVVTGNRSRAG